MSDGPIYAHTVEFDKHRWYLRIIIEKPSGEKVEYVASADSTFTYGDGIWFGTLAEYEEARAEL